MKRKNTIINFLDMELLYVNEAAKRLRISRSKFYELISDGGLDRYVKKIGGRYRIWDSDLIKYVNESE